MARYIKGKDGKFAGSIGSGKTRPPKPAPSLPSRPGLTTDDFASLGLTTQNYTHHNHGTRTLPISDAGTVLDEIDTHLDTDIDVLDYYGQHATDEQFEENLIHDAASVETIRIHLFYAKEHLTNEMHHRTDADPQRSLVTNETTRARDIAHLFTETAQRAEATGHDTPGTAIALHLNRAGEWFESSQFLDGLSANASVEEIADFRARTQLARFHTRQAAAHMDAQTGPQRHPFTSPPASAFVASAHSAAAYDIRHLRGLVKLNTALVSGQDSHQKALAMTHLHNAHAATYAADTAV